MTDAELQRLADLVAQRVTCRPILVDTRTAAGMVGMGVDAFRRDVAPFVAVRSRT